MTRHPWQSISRQTMSLIHVARNNSVLGQFTEEEIRAGLANGTYLGSDLAWKAGKKDWAPLCSWPEFGKQNADRTASGGGEMLPQPPPCESGDAPAMPTWERPEAGGIALRYFASVKEILFRPTATFSAMPAQGGLLRPMSFYMLTQFPTAILMGAAAWALSGTHVAAEKNPGMEAFGGLDGGALASAYLLFLGLLAPVLVFVWSAIQHAILKLWGVANEDYEATLRVIAYIWGATGLLSLPFSLLSMLPVVGQFFGTITLPIGVYGMVIQIIALMKVHKADGAKVTGAVLSPILLCCCGGAIFAGGAGIFAASMMHR